MPENQQPPLTTIDELRQRAQAAQERGERAPIREAHQPGTVAEKLTTLNAKLEGAEPVDLTPTQTGQNNVKLNELGEIVND